jgi:predicted Zn-dependent peptidase
MKHVLLSAALLSVMTLSAQTKPGNKKPLDVAQKKTLKYETATNDPLKVRIYTLKNGMKVYLSVYKNAPRVQTYIGVRAGSKNDPANATGLAHYLEHMVFKGTDQYGTKDFAKENAEIKKIEALYEVYRQTKDETQRKKIYHQIDSVSGVAAKYAIANEYDKMSGILGAQGTNAFTSFDQTVYVNDIPSNQIDTWLKLEAERFRKPVLRLFHTELEAVYEEKNRGLDNDNNKSYEAAFEALFKKHTYGTQTTIGTIEHLKNPSMKEINKYYNTYYVPNNMAIIMSGDFDPDKVIVEIEKNFGSYKPKPVQPYKFQKEEPITQKIVREVIGPDAANVGLAWRLEGAGTRDAELATLMTSLLFNGKAGMMDINLNQAQKVLGSNAAFFSMNDYSFFTIGGSPKEGQTLEDVEKLVYGEIDKIKKGQVEDWLLQAVITDMKLAKTKELENNSSRAGIMLDAFVSQTNWQKQTDFLERVSKITKQEIVDFANKNFNENNYVVVYKRIGEDKNIQKVEKPTITPVEVDRENQSPFLKKVANAPYNALEPRFIDYEKDITRTTIKSNIPVLYNQNTENKIFELYYKFELGGKHDKILPVAVDYIPLLGTKDMSPAQVQQEFYKLGCSFEVFNSLDNTWVMLSGLSENFDKAVRLFEKVLNEPVVEQEALKGLIANTLKQRADDKLNKQLIMRGMNNYARYGAISPFTYKATNEELNKISVDDIMYKIKLLSTYEHKVLYYGPMSLDDVKFSLNSYHIVPAKLTVIPAAYNFVEKTLDNTVYVADYDMKQVEIMMLSSGHKYDKSLVPIISLYNEYFGGGMSSVMFQDLRESKALAYSTYGNYAQPREPQLSYVNVLYIGSQADKLKEAIDGVKGLVENMPKADATFSAVKEGLIQDIRAARINKSQILFDYENALKFSLNSDIRKDIFEKVPGYQYADILNFHNQYIKGKPQTMLVVGKKDGLDIKLLEKLGPVKTLTLQDIFGY